ncbi:MAG TPA: hydrogenase formation protein HypD [Verrucomicrobiae bacterium]|nr:hydrogenase formation protein HypD [Verrucomicrobiae bacterium]
MKTLVQTIEELAGRLGRDVELMEVCGTHTMVAFRTGLRQLLPESVRLRSGPGCPVCVTDASYIDAAVELCRRPDVVVATFGDLLRVPGSESSLDRERAAGGSVRIVYSPSDALVLAKECPSKRVVFLGVGFETTAPTVAWSIWRAARDGVRNFSVLCAHKTMPRAMDALLRDQQVKIDGFLCPGHVSVITGAAVYRFIGERYKIPCVIAGFEAWDILKSINMLLTQILDGRAAVEIEYSRSVTEHGNAAAQRLIVEVFEPNDAIWRGIGTISGSGLAIRSKYSNFDATHAIGVKFGEAHVNPLCRCGDILRGISTPLDCRLFGCTCTPAHPIGPCMVSSEGTCAAYYKYEGRVAA